MEKEKVPGDADGPESLRDGNEEKVDPGGLSFVIPPRTNMEVKVQIFV